MAVQTPPPCLLRRRPAVEVQLRNPKHPQQNQTRAHRKHKPKRNKKLDSPTAGRFGRRTPRPATSSSGSGRGCRSPSRLTPNATTPPIQLPPIGGTIHEQIPSRAAPQSCARIRSPSAAPPPHRALLRSDAALCSPPLPTSRSIQPNQIKTKPKRAASRGEDSPVSTHPRAPPREAVAPRGDEKTARRSAEEEAGLRSEAKRSEARRSRGKRKEEGGEKEGGCGCGGGGRQGRLCVGRTQAKHGRAWGKKKSNGRVRFIAWPYQFPGSPSVAHVSSSGGKIVGDTPVVILHGSLLLTLSQNNINSFEFLSIITIHLI